MMQKLRYDSIVRKLKKEGLRFSEFSLVTEGEYSRDDADWNYKDVPHLHHVHHLAEAYPLVIGDEVICNINLQCILGIWFPIALIIYEMEKYRQVYATTLLMFVLVVETVMEEPQPLHAVTTTTYSIGYPRWLFFLVPAMRWLIKRNYKVLMEADIPMRERRGELRKLGYNFKRKGETYGYIETVNIFDSNVVAPSSAAAEQSTDYQAAFGASPECAVGDAGLLGLKLTRAGDKVTVWPRTCPHEGAALNHEKCAEGKIRCPWHGREFAPIGQFDWGSDSSFTSKEYAVKVAGNQLTWRYLGATNA
jgi:nitrite reductase/ring-hydroxylating ferredoxin subunit